MIRFDAVTRHYGNADAPALREISVEFQRGDFVFLIGASGSGKSTLLRMVLREALPQRGKVTVAGQNLSLMMPRRVPEYRRSIGMVFQDFRLLPDKTIYENVAFAMRVIGAPRSAIRNRVMTVLSRVNLEHLAKRYPHEISGGEQQRAAIARAIINSPAILLADEPTGNLDPRASEEVMKILRWINDSGTTVIMATHDRAIVDRMARRVVQLHHGELVRDDAEGVYDPVEGSPAWNVLREEAEKTGLRAQDPMPLRTELTPIVPAAISAHPSPETAGSAATPEDHSENPAESTDTDQLSPVTRYPVTKYRVTWPEDEVLTDEESASWDDAAALPSDAALPTDTTAPTASAVPHAGSKVSADSADHPTAAPMPTPRAEPASPPVPQFPRPRASAAEATYSDTRRTADQLRGSRPRSLFGRKRGRG